MKNQDGQVGGRAEIDRLKEGTFCGGRKMRRAERKERERKKKCKVATMRKDDVTACPTRRSIFLPTKTPS